MHLRRATTPAMSFLPLLFAGLLATAHPAALAVGNPVQVNVTNASPIPVDPTGGFAPVNGYCSGTGASYIVDCPLYTVPAGKRLFVDSVTWKLLAAPTNVTSELLFGLDTITPLGPVGFVPSARTILIQHSVTYGNGNAYVYEGTQSVQMVFEAGETFSGEYVYSSGGAYTQQFSFQGHLVNAP